MTTTAPTLAQLAADVSGPVLTAADPDYAQEIAAFNLAHRIAPAVVVGATSTADVVAAVRFATANGRKVAAQATGHGLLGDLDGAVLITTHRMAQVSIAVAAKTAVVGAGTRFRAVIDAAAPYGLAPVCGASSSVGVVGLTLGGGIGPLSRSYGLAADHVRRVRIVTADGVIRDIDASSDPELFWAVRGGKGGFGIVTEVELGLVDVARFYGGGLFFPASSTTGVLHAWAEWARQLPESTSTSLAFLQLPPDPALPEPLRGTYVAHLRLVHLGSADEGAALLAPMRAVAWPVMDTVAEMPFAAIDAVHMDPSTPLPVHERGCAVTALPTDALDVLLQLAGPDAQSPLLMLEIRLLGGAIGRRPANPPSASGRDAAFTVHAVGVPAGPELAELVAERAAAVVAAMRPWAARGQLNFLGSAPGSDLESLWEPAEWERLLAVKGRVDPLGTFSTGQSAVR